MILLFLFGFHDICNQMGQEVLASYTYKGKVIEKSIVVGSNDCMGACGKDCWFKKTRYTRECLNHDLCHRETKDIVECQDELNKAIQTFKFATRCNLKNEI